MSIDGISLSIHGATLKEFFERFESFARRFGYVLTVSPATEAAPVETGGYADFPQSDDVGAKTAQAAVDAPIRRRPGRPAKVAAATAAPATEQAQLHLDPVGERDGPPATLDDAKDAGRVVIHKGGVDALRGLLTEFQVGKIGELKKEAWSRFIVRCHEVARGDA